MRRNHPTSRRRRVFLLALGVALLGALALATGADANIAIPDAGPTHNAQETKNLYVIILIIGLIIFVGVEAALVYAVIRFRAKKHPVAAQIHGNTRLEIGWTIAPAVILVGLAVVTFVKLDPIRDPQNSGPNGYPVNTVLTADTNERLPPNGKAMDIEVNGQQYIWRYTYPKKEFGNLYSYEEMVVPVNTTITLDITAQDVDHSWWIPELGGKFDAIPGYVNHTWFKITKPGVYYGQCAELCGRNHANMVARVRAVPVDEFKAWVQQKKADIQAANDSIQQVRGQIAKNGFQPKDAATATANPTAQQTTP